LLIFCIFRGVFGYLKLILTSTTIGFTINSLTFSCVLASAPPYAGQWASYSAKFRPPLAQTSSYATGYQDLFGGTGFIAPDVLFKTTIDGTPKNTDVIQTGAPAKC